MDDLTNAVETPNNAEEIQNCVQVCFELGFETRDISEVFDRCVDETAVDVLVANGGNPSVTCGGLAFDDHQAIINNVKRRLYHGARGLTTYDAEEAKRVQNNIGCGQGAGVRPFYYYRVDEEKIDFFLNFKPSVYTTTGYQSEPVQGGGGGDYQSVCEVDGRVMYRRPLVKVQHGNTSRTVYTTKYLTLREWESAERAFGKYHRTINVMISCMRGLGTKKLKSCEECEECQHVKMKYFIHSLPLVLVKMVLTYV